MRLDGLDDLLADAGIAQVALGHLPQGWTRDALLPCLAPMAEHDKAIMLLADLDRATWPHARAGFFAVRKQIPAILAELGIG